MQNISGTNAATWRQKLAADIPSFHCVIQTRWLIMSVNYSCKSCETSGSDLEVRKREKCESFERWMEPLNLIWAIPWKYFNFAIRSQCYKTIYVRNLRIFVISWSVCGCQALSGIALCSWVRPEPIRVKQLSGALL